MTMVLDQWPLLVTLGGILFVAGLIQSLVGFGYAMIALAMLPFVLNARDAHIIVSLSGIPALMLAGCLYRHNAHLKPLLIALAGALVLLPIGLWVFKSLPVRGLVQLTGGAVLLFAISEFFDYREIKPAWNTSPGKLLLAGGLSGFLAGAVSIGGPPIATFALRQNWSPEAFRAFVTLFLLIQSLMKLGGLSVGGFLEARVLTLSLWTIPFTLAGVMAGARVARRLDARRYRYLVAGALILAGGSLVLTPANPEDPESQNSEMPKIVDSPPVNPVDVRGE